MECLRRDGEFTRLGMLKGPAYDAYLRNLQLEMDRNDKWLAECKDADPLRPMKHMRQRKLHELHEHVLETHADGETEQAPWASQEKLNNLLDTGLPIHLTYSLLRRTRDLLKGRTEDALTIVQVAQQFAESEEGGDFLLGRARIFTDSIGFEYGADFEVRDLRFQARYELREIMHSLRGDEPIEPEGPEELFQ